MDKKIFVTSIQPLLMKYRVNNIDFADDLVAIMTPKRIRKLDLLFSQDECLNDLYYLPEGITRYFVTTKDGREVTKTFKIGPIFVSSTYAMHTGQPSPFSSQMLHDSTVYRIAIDEWYQLVDTNLVFAKFYARILEDRFVEKEKRELSLLHESTTTQYLQFLEKFSKYADLIPQWMVASYLGITPEALSRIKKRLQA